MASLKRRFGPAQSPVVATTIAKKQSEAKAASALGWGAVSILGAVVLGLDLYFHLLPYLLPLQPPSVQYAELALIVLLLLCALYDVTVYVNIHLSAKRVQLTPAQKRLLGVSSAGGGFSTVQFPVPFGSPLSSTSYSTSRTPPLYYLSPTGSTHSSVQGTPQSVSFANSHTPTPGSYQGHSAHKASPFSGDKIADFTTLDSFLRGEEDREQRILRGSPDLGSPQTPTYWYGRQGSDYSPSPRKYHVASRSHSPSTHPGDGDSPFCRETDSVWTKLGIKKDEVIQWTENCRKWLAQTVVVPVANEIETINETLCKIHSPDLQIGAVGLGTLRKVARSKVQYVPTLGTVIPYLELSAKQEYLVQRIKELAKGGFISAYRWNSGGMWKERAWDQDLPNDSQILMHLLCTYLDNCMPPNPRFPDGRPFSSQYFLRAPDKPAAKKTDVCIYQASTNPPHYKVLVKDTCVDLPQGRNTLFHAIVVFLHHLKTEEKSMLGQINLELSGINILWIIQ